jgi:hypothetical protein
VVEELDDGELLSSDNPYIANRELAEKYRAYKRQLR